ncbi:methyltransferase domain-containing protein [Haloarcula sp. 1CSR25-25]|uniref:class I SAM-dependent methyltransferase n=1 Tax=Haloarcula sp. 1CSR25-25 TaxID=2862545 RepID=UPI00289383E6|nr:methyltransferase domain-containing protein [Haloarcula sp. 1CSR25-25]MDT3434875.1 methyltransferase domain-containing protein [Haloarcula sp. 1CSR25-25]
MTVSNWWNRTRYGLYAPVYDWGAQPLERGRRRAIERLDIQSGDRVLIPGSGTGMDLEHLPAGVEVTAIDVTPAMVRRTERRGNSLGLDVDARVGDARSLSFEDDSFDVVLLHLILSVISHPERVVAETARVLDSEGRVSIYDKFVPEGTRPSLLRRAINPVARFLFADLTRRLEPMTADTDLELTTEESFLGGIYTVTIAAPSCRESSTTTESV